MHCGLGADTLCASADFVLTTLLLALAGELMRMLDTVIVNAGFSERILRTVRCVSRQSWFCVAE